MKFEYFLIYRLTGTTIELGYVPDIDWEFWANKYFLQDLENWTLEFRVLKSLVARIEQLRLTGLIIQKVVPDATSGLATNFTRKTDIPERGCQILLKSGWVRIE